MCCYISEYICIYIYMRVFIYVDIAHIYSIYTYIYMLGLTPKINIRTPKAERERALWRDVLWSRSIFI